MDLVEDLIEKVKKFRLASGKVDDLWVSVHLGHRMEREFRGWILDITVTGSRGSITGKFHFYDYEAATKAFEEIVNRYKLIERK